MDEPTDNKMNLALGRKLDDCRKVLRELRSVVVAYSGGVDSTLLLALAMETLGSENVLAVVATSPIHPRLEFERARRMAGGLGAELLEIHSDELSPEVVSNSPQRCYHCKSQLLVELKRIAVQRGLDMVVTGANADDAGDFRPGLRAVAEQAARSPLAEAGMTKADVRAAARQMDIAIWNLPSAACLASRIPYGQPLTLERLKRVERAEASLKELGFDLCRVRDHDTVARIEVPPQHLRQIARLRDRIVRSLREIGYAYVTLDLEGFRSGSMNEVLEKTDRRDPTRAPSRTPRQSD